MPKLTSANEGRGCTHTGQWDLCNSTQCPLYGVYACICCPYLYGKKNTLWDYFLPRIVVRAACTWLFLQCCTGLMKQSTGIAHYSPALYFLHWFHKNLYIRNKGKKQNFAYTLSTMEETFTSSLKQKWVGQSTAKNSFLKNAQTSNAS